MASNMRANNNRYKLAKAQVVTLIVAIITALGVIISAYIQSRPSEVKNATQLITSPVKRFVLAGTIVDASTTESVSQASIELVGRNKQYISEQNGNFRIQINDTTSAVRLRVLKNGYQPYDRSYDLSNETIIVQLLLKKSYE